jgi:hypothetical protein
VIDAGGSSIDSCLIPRDNLSVNAAPDAATLLTRFRCDLAMGELAVDSDARTDIVSKAVETALI